MDLEIEAVCGFIKPLAKSDRHHLMRVDVIELRKKCSELPNPGLGDDLTSRLLGASVTLGRQLELQDIPLDV